MDKEKNDGLLFDTDETYDEMSNEEVPDFVQKFAEKQDLKAKQEKIFAAEVIAIIALVIIGLFWFCFYIYA